MNVVTPSGAAVTLIRWIWLGEPIDQKNPLLYDMPGPATAPPTLIVEDVLVRRFTLVSVEEPLLPT